MLQRRDAGWGLDNEVGLGYRTVQGSTELAVVGQGVRNSEGCQDRPLSRASRAESVTSLAPYPPTYDTTVQPSELRNQNLYIQSLQHRQPQVHVLIIPPD